MEGEFFYAGVLDKAGATVTWSYEQLEDQGSYKLLVKQFLLGHEAKEGEYNVVEVDTMSADHGLTVPIAVLKAGETRTILTHLEFPEAPVNFKLVAGNGPVFIHGNQVPQYMDNVEEVDEAIEEAVEEEQEEEKPPSKKRKMAENGSKANNGSSNGSSNGKSNGSSNGTSNDPKNKKPAK